MRDADGEFHGHRAARNGILPVRSAESRLPGCHRLLGGYSGQPPERCKIFAAGGRESAGRSEDQAVLNESSATVAGHPLH